MEQARRVDGCGVGGLCDGAVLSPAVLAGAGGHGTPSTAVYSDREQAELAEGIV
ncbi:hypothetical protein [Streptomyces canus]|uniref:hypothetical protein n=1 Tax=Streptomyces canus TaxID=58343 RepID=UPI00386719FD